MHRYIEVRLKQVGFHAWPGAVAECGFLANLHRHTFTFRLRLQVDHADRDVEFTLVRRDMINHVQRVYSSIFDGHYFGDLSCEALAEAMAFDLKKGYHVLECSVSEDDEFEGGVICHA